VHISNLVHHVIKLVDAFKVDVSVERRTAEVVIEARRGVGDVAAVDPFELDRAILFNRVDERAKLDSKVLLFLEWC
jgi:hypothetical protein